MEDRARAWRKKGKGREGSGEWCCVVLLAGLLLLLLLCIGLLLLLGSWYVPSDILSNSSMQQTPRSDNTRAPDSNTNSLVSGSFVTYAVRPTAEEPLPEV